jgi:hypothetical protein
LAPFISSNALVVTVVPWLKKSISLDLFYLQLAGRRVGQHQIRVGAAHIDAETVISHGSVSLRIEYVL